MLGCAGIARQAALRRYDNRKSEIVAAKRVYHLKVSDPALNPAASVDIICAGLGFHGG